MSGHTPGDQLDLDERRREFRELQAQHNVNHCTTCRDWGALGERHEDHAHRRPGGSE